VEPAYCRRCVCVCGEISGTWRERACLWKRSLERTCGRSQPSRPTLDSRPRARCRDDVVRGAARPRRAAPESDVRGCVPQGRGHQVHRATSSWDAGRAAGNRAHQLTPPNPSTVGEPPAGAPGAGDDHPGARRRAACVGGAARLDALLTITRLRRVDYPGRRVDPSRSGRRAVVPASPGLKLPGCRCVARPNGLERESRSHMPGKAFPSRLVSAQ
jgi:hypothetical protein